MRLYHSHHPDHVRTMDTTQLRDQFLLSELFVPGELRSAYSLLDRMVISGGVPLEPIDLTVDQHLLGTSFMLERRELGIINIGNPGSVIADGKQFDMGHAEVLYISRGTREISLASSNADSPAHFLCLSGPAHADFPTTHVGPAGMNQVSLGSKQACNERTLFQAVHQNGIQSCNLVMGFTTVSEGSVWNTMPCHTHTRRMELYCYFDLAPEHRVFHLMGEPTETRHLVVAGGQAVLSPSWSIHSGAGTADYSFVWAMLGDNQSFDDMDGVAIGELR